MAYETKAILRGLANQIALAKPVKQAYEMIKGAADVEGISLPAYEEAKNKYSGGEAE